jgi:hypothetical protein
MILYFIYSIQYQINYEIFYINDCFCSHPARQQNKNISHRQDKKGTNLEKYPGRDNLRKNEKRGE